MRTTLACHRLSASHIRHAWHRLFMSARLSHSHAAACCRLPQALFKREDPLRLIADARQRPQDRMTPAEVAGVRHALGTSPLSALLDVKVGAGAASLLRACKHSALLPTRPHVQGVPAQRLLSCPLSCTCTVHLHEPAHGEECMLLTAGLEA